MGDLAVNPVQLQLDEDQARELYRLLHQQEDQSRYHQAYGQLQRYFFDRLTIAELQELLEADE
jgi:hypothetical protein